MGWNLYRDRLGLSDYVEYTVPRFVEVEGSSSVLIDSNFSFFVYTVPQNVLFCLLMFLLFHLVRHFRIRKFVKKFYFIKTVFAIAMLEENLGYFVFVCFSHLAHSFSFNFADKFSLGLTVAVLFSLLIFALCFYLLISQYLRKRATHFSEFTYRESAGFCYKVLQLSLRSVLRSVVFCFFCSQYNNKLLMLCAIEALMITVTITL